MVTGVAKTYARFGGPELHTARLVRMLDERFPGWAGLEAVAVDAGTMLLPVAVRRRDGLASPIRFGLIPTSVVTTPMPHGSTPARTGDVLVRADDLRASAAKADRRPRREWVRVDGRRVPLHLADNGDSTSDAYTWLGRFLGRVPNGRAQGEAVRALVREHPEL